MLPLLLVNMNASTRVGPFDRLSAGYLVPYTARSHLGC
jgi:hypothetical protein